MKCQHSIYQAYCIIQNVICNALGFCSNMKKNIQHTDGEYEKTIVEQVK